MSRRNSLFSVIFCVVASVAVRGDDAAPANATPATQRGVLVFRSGRVVEGEIAETETHYVVVRAVGKIEVPKGDVESVAKNLDDVYRQKAMRLNDRDADAHFKLAQWCLQVNLRERAIAELERSAELSDNPAKVQGILDALRRAPAAPKPKPAPPVAEVVEPHENTAAAVRHPLEKDVTPPLLSTFTVQIQPLLARSCGTTGCHDANHAGSFALQRSTLANQRATQHNLRAALSGIDADEPDASALLAFAARPHPRTERDASSTPLGSAAFTTLNEWIRNVARKSTGGPEDVLPAQTATAPGNAPVAAQPNVASDDPSTPMNIVRSNRPFELTRSRARAGMTHRPSLGAKSPPASAPTPTVQTGKQPAPVTNRPAVSAPDASPDAKSGGQPQDVAATPTNRLAPRDRSAHVATPQNAASDKRPAAESYQAVDPFDTEIFNRQFAPRDAATRP